MKRPTMNRAVWDVLVRHAGASERMFPEFDYAFPGCVEFRFQGDLGFGGKVWWDRGRAYVTCYSEDATPERDAQIRHVNDLLAEVAS